MTIGRITSSCSIFFMEDFCEDDGLPDQDPATTLNAFGMNPAHPFPGGANFRLS
jgi:hypothetical protein